MPAAVDSPSAWRSHVECGYGSGESSKSLMLTVLAVPDLLYPYSPMLRHLRAMLGNLVRSLAGLVGATAIPRGRGS